jgi:cell division protein FtsA
VNELSRLPPPAEPPGPKRRRRRDGRSGTFGVLDIGSTKIVCVIARVEGAGTDLPEPRVLGFGWQRSRGVRAGNVVDLEEAESAIRAAVGQAEEMADTQLRGAIVNLSCGQPESHHQRLQWPIGGRAVTEADLRAILGEGQRRSAEDGRETVHVFPLGFTVDATPGAEDPRGMVCDALGARLHLVDAAQTSLRNLGACLLRCDLEVEELVSAPFAAGLATLVEDEKRLGATLIDMGGGTTTMAVFGDGHLLHTAQLPVGGWNVTNDLARGLSTPLAHAERLKTLHGGVLSAPDDEREWLPVPQVGEDEHHIQRMPRAFVVNIIRPRLEETFELAKDCLAAAGLSPEIGRRVVLTGGASQLVGARELAARVLDRQVRLGRPHAVRGLPESASGPAFAATLGLLAWGAGEGRPLLDILPGAHQRTGMFRRVVDWLRDRA